MEKALSWILSKGVLISVVLILSGLGLMLITGDTSNPFGIMELEWMIWGNSFFEPSHILFLGYAVLIMIPIISIAVSIVMYLRAHDLPFTVITLIVFGILIASMTFGIG